MATEDGTEKKKEVATRNVPKPGHLPMTELLFGRQGPPSPFGEDLRFPLPVEQLDYQHPSAPEG